jgi:hypothetical protein
MKLIPFELKDMQGVLYFSVCLAACSLTQCYSLAKGFQRHTDALNVRTQIVTIPASLTEEGNMASGGGDTSLLGPSLRGQDFISLGMHRSPSPTL